MHSNRLGPWIVLKTKTPLHSARTMERWVSAENRLEEKSDEAFARVIGFDRDGEDGFRLVLSCKKLLKQATEQAANFSSPIILTDGTYKTNHLGWPLLVIGIHDLNGKFRIMAVMISSREREEDYCFFVTSVRRALWDFCGFAYENHAEVYGNQDGAMSIRNGIRKSFREFQPGSEGDVTGGVASAAVQEEEDKEENAELVHPEPPPLAAAEASSHEQE